MEQLIGQLGCPRNNLFGEFARTQIRPFYRKIYAAKYAPILNPSELRTLRWWAAILTSPKPRVPRGVDRGSDFDVYADASTKSNKMAAMAIHMVGGKPCISKLLVSPVPKFRRMNFYPVTRGAYKYVLCVHLRLKISP